MSFENINIESINICPGLDHGGGIRTKLYFAPASYFFQTTLPKPSDSLKSEITIDREVLMFPGKNLYYIEILIDENDLRISSTGSKSKKRLVSNLSIFIPGFRAEVLGFIKRCLNIPMIFFVQDSNNNNWQIGNFLNYAYLENIDVSTGKKYEDNSGAAVTILSNSTAYLYNHPLDFAKPGDFNEDFSEDYFIYKT